MQAGNLVLAQSRYVVLRAGVTGHTHTCLLLATHTTVIPNCCGTFWLQNSIPHIVTRESKQSLPPKL